jgi:hypothetical protein
MTSQKNYYLICTTNEGLGGASSPLLTHVFPDASGVNCEARIITLLLVESPTTDFIWAFGGEWARAAFGISLLMVVVKSLETGEMPPHVCP